MAKRSLGTSGKIIAGCTYLILLYALISLYLTGGSAWIMQLLPKHNLNLNFAIIGLASITGLVIFTGTKATDLLNRLLSIGLGLSYLILIIICAPKVL
jgi:tyrosine-specific transport protein